MLEKACKVGISLGKVDETAFCTHHHSRIENLIPMLIPNDCRNAATSHRWATLVQSAINRQQQAQQPPPPFDSLALISDSIMLHMNEGPECHGQCLGQAGSPAYHIQLAWPHWSIPFSIVHFMVHPMVQGDMGDGNRLCSAQF